MTKNATETPLTCDCTKRIVFKNNNIIEQYSNDSLKSSELYRIEENPYDPDDMFILRNKNISGNIYVKNDTLGIGWFGACASLDYFVKKQD